jgi:hypothetical protein
MTQLLWQQRRASTEAILARIAADPAFRQQLRADPGQAVVAVGGSEQVLDSAEVVGYCKITCTYTCKITRRPK